MPTSVREQALAGFFALFAGLSTYPLKRRMPNWTIDTSEMPCLIQLDGGADSLGGDDASSGFGGIMRISQQVSVVAGIRAQPVAGADPDLGPLISAAIADIKAAVAADPTLSGLAENIRWDGDEDPVTLLEEGAPPHVVVAVNFAIIHTQAELDPYSAM